MESKGFKTPTDSRHSSHLLALWAKEQREDFGLGRMDGVGRERAEKPFQDDVEKLLLSGRHSRALGSP